MALVADVRDERERLWFKEQTREFTRYQLYQAYERQLDGFGELLRVFTVTWGWDSETSTLSTFLVPLLRIVGLWGNLDFLMGRFFNFGSGIGTYRLEGEEIYVFLDVSE